WIKIYWRISKFQSARRSPGPLITSLQKVLDILQQKTLRLMTATTLWSWIIQIIRNEISKRLQLWRWNWRNKSMPLEVSTGMGQQKYFWNPSVEGDLGIL